MKKELRILVILIAVLLVGTVGYYFMPKKFGKNVNPSEVDHINVFDGNTGTGFTITDSEDIEYIVANIQGISMKRDGISLGRTGYSFKISYINSNDKDIIPVFILNSDNTICKDPFFYRCDGGLCFDYLKACEEKYRTNVTEFIEEKKIIVDKCFDGAMVFTLIIMVIILLVLTPVGIVVDKKIEAYFENKRERTLNSSLCN